MSGELRETSPSCTCHPADVVPEADTGASPSYVERDKADLLRRLARVEGQVRGIKRMIEEDKYCVDILVQVSAARAALQNAALKLLEQHTRGCVARAIEEDHGGEAIDELMTVLSRFVK